MMKKELTLTKPALKAIYERIGGEEGLRRIVLDFYSRMSEDVLIGFFFMGRDLEHIADMQRQFLMKAMGAAESYSGRLPAQAHEKLPPILRGHFDRRLKILEATLEVHGLSESDIQVWIEFENAFRSVIEQNP
jgi:hemoglobin